MNKNSNAYIIIYATVMVIVVALVLAWASLSLQGRQNANVENEVKGAILQTIGQGGDAAKVKDKTAYINEQYTKYIVEDFAVNAQGERVGDANAFELLGNLKAEYGKPAAERVLPVFVSRDDSGTVRYILPLWGSGLWGPVWGYLALESDWDTIYGAVFDHKGETPGLGAEIASDSFEEQFRGKTIFRDGKLVSIAVAKGKGAAGADALNTVDAISGGTITSRGVENMLRDNLRDYLPYIEKMKAGVTSSSIGVIKGADGQPTAVFVPIKNMERDE